MRNLIIASYPHPPRLPPFFLATIRTYEKCTRHCTRRLLDASSDDLHSMLRSRMSHWQLHANDGTPSLDSLLTIWLNNIRTVAKHNAGFLALGAVRTVCNAWCTSRRFGGEVLPCRLGGQQCGNDDLRHYLSCATVGGALQLEVGISWASPDGQNLRHKLLLTEGSDQCLLLRAVAIDLVLFSVNASRAKGTFWDFQATREVIRGRARTLHRLSPVLHQILLQLRLQTWT